MNKNRRTGIHEQGTGYRAQAGGVPLIACGAQVGKLDGARESGHVGHARVASRGAGCKLKFQLAVTGEGVVDRYRAGRAGIVQNQRRTRAHRDRATAEGVGRRRYGGLESAAAGIDDGTARVGVGSGKVQGARAGLGEAHGTAADDTIHGERVGVHRDGSVGAHGDSAGAEVEILAAGKGEVTIPGLGIVARVHEVCNGAVETAAGEGEGAGADGVRTAKHQNTGIEDGASGITVGVVDGKTAAAILGQAAAGDAEASGQDIILAAVVEGG